MALLVTQVPLPSGEEDPTHAVAQALGLPPERILAVRIVRTSLDARRRPPLRRVNCRVELAPADEDALLARGQPQVRRFEVRDGERAGLLGASATPPRPWPRASRPLVVGAGPAGLFCALRLAEAGARPLLVERGEEVEVRRHKVAAFWARGELDPESNVVFGEGGAGTFSDGKLNTRLRSGQVGYVLDRLVRFGAPPAVLTDALPHVGTDRLRAVLVRLRRCLLELGAEVLFRARVVDLLLDRGVCAGVRLQDGVELDGQPVVLATGHAAADSAEAFLRAGLAAEARPFAVGVRIEHPRAFIDQARLGRSAGALPAATYRLVAPSREGRRQAYSFCMCPGGLVIPTAERQGLTVVNGMSCSQRASRWSNAALVVQVAPPDFPSAGPLGGLMLRERIERAAWAVGGPGHAAPAQRAADFLAGRESNGLPRASHPHGVTPCDLRALLPGSVVMALLAGIAEFERRIPGFAGPDAVLIAPETRTASPWRFLRGPDRQALGVRGCYPIGEGLGWGGGIVSAAVDGVKSAEAMISASSP